MITNNNIPIIVKSINLLLAVRSDRNLYSKNLSETQNECEEFKRRYKIVDH